MPALTRVFAKTSLFYLLVGLSTGVVLALRGWVRLPPLLTVLSPVYFHLLMLGWIAQLIFGVVYWMFPKYSPKAPRGREWLGWAVYGLLNAGLVLRAVAEPALAVYGGGWGGVLVIAAVLQWLAGLGFVVNTWPRVKER